MTSGQPLPDILDKGLRVVFCGINPSLHAATVGYHFAGHSNRFWRVLHLSGFTPELISAENDRSILKYGCGLTTAVDRPTVRAGELAKHEFGAASAKLARKIQRYAPGYLAFLGKAAYTALFNQREVAWGRQTTVFGGAKVWVLPNPSGLNCAFRLEQLVDAYRELREVTELRKIGKL
jgi:TDG/mug DNA glycosylase family protein